MRRRLQAKRLAREAWRGYDVEAVVAQLREFVQQEGDMHAFDPCGKHGLVRGASDGAAIVAAAGAAPA